MRRCRRDRLGDILSYIFKALMFFIVAFLALQRLIPSVMTAGAVQG